MADTSSGVMTSPHMRRALELAEQGARAGEIPVGAVLTDADGNILAEAHNLVERERDPTAHAEIVAIRKAAAAIGSPRLVGAKLYVTLEPCAMCAQAIAHARIDVVYFGAEDPKGGGVLHGARIFQQPTCHHKPEVYSGFLADESAALLQRFFSDKRG